MPLLTNQFNTEFTPAASPFSVEITGPVYLQKRADASAQWDTVGIIRRPQLVDNPVAGTRYRFVQYGAVAYTPRADQ